MVHFHVLVDRYLPKTLLSRLWARAGGGSVVDIGMIRSSANYVLKYLAKSPDYSREVEVALFGKRRYSASRGLLLRITPSASWIGATYSAVFPALAKQARVLCVVDGVYYYQEDG